MSHLLGPACRFQKKLALGRGVKGYLFSEGKRLVAVVWAVQGAKPKPIRLADERLALWDIMARPQKGRQFWPGGTPVYLIAEGLSSEEFAKALR